jgi:hypothetical protein
LGRGVVIQDKKMAEALNKLVDKPWALCDESKGIDCLNSVKSFYEDLGFKWPDSGEWEGYTWKNYAEMWDRDCKKAKHDLVRFLRSFGKEVQNGFYLRGDLLILKVEEANWKKKAMDAVGNTLPKGFRALRRILQDRRPEAFPAIFMGNGHIFSVFDKGGKVLPFRAFKPFIIEARRYI